MNINKPTHLIHLCPQRNARKPAVPSGKSLAREVRAPGSQEDRKEAWKSAQTKIFYKDFINNLKNAFLSGNLQMLLKYEYFKRNLYSISSSKIEENLWAISETVYIQSSHFTRWNNGFLRY